MLKTLYIDLDNVLVDFRSAFPHSLEEKYAGHLDDIPGIFSLMRPMANAVESFQERRQAVANTSSLARRSSRTGWPSPRISGVRPNPSFQRTAFGGRCR